MGIEVGYGRRGNLKRNGFYDELVHPRWGADWNAVLGPPVAPAATNLLPLWGVELSLLGLETCLLGETRK